MVGEKASPAKKNTHLRPTLFAVVALIAVERRAFNSPHIFCFQVRSKLRSVRSPPSPSTKLLDSALHTTHPNET